MSFTDSDSGRQVYIMNLTFLQKCLRERRAAYEALESRLQALGAQQRALKEIDLNPRLGN